METGVIVRMRPGPQNFLEMVIRQEGEHVGKCGGRSGLGLTQSVPTPSYLGHITAKTSAELWGHQGGRHMVDMKAVSSAGPAPIHSALWQSRGPGLPSETRLL